MVTYRDVLNKAIRFPTSALYDLITSGGHGLPVTPGYETALKTVQRYGLDIPVDPRVGNRKDLRVATFIKNDDIESIRLVELKGLTEDLESDKKKAAKLRLDAAKLQTKIAAQQEKEAAKEI